MYASVGWKAFCIVISFLVLWSIFIEVLPSSISRMVPDGSRAVKINQSTVLSILPSICLLVLVLLCLFLFLFLFFLFLFFFFSSCSLIFFFLIPFSLIFLLFLNFCSLLLVFPFFFSPFSFSFFFFSFLLFLYWFSHFFALINLQILTNPKQQLFTKKYTKQIFINENASILTSSRLFLLRTLTGHS